MKGKVADKEICTFSEGEIEELAKYFMENNVKKLYTGHCTGVVGYELIKKYLDDKLEYIYTGKEIEI